MIFESKRKREPRRGRRSAFLQCPANAERSAAGERVELVFEQLEQLLLLSAAPVELTANNWRQATVSIGDETPVSLAGDVAAAQAGTGLALIGGTLEQQRYGLTGAGYSVAIIDTGLDYTNPAFQGRYLGGWNFVGNNDNPMDDNGHGTHVAGIIGSADPNHLGVAPGVGLIALKVLDSSGSGSFNNVDLALKWVAAHQQQDHIVAVNMSLGSGNYLTEPWTFLDGDMERLNQEGVFVAVASGNSYYAYGSQAGLGFPSVNSDAVSVGAVWAGHYGAVSWADGAKDFSTAPDQITSFTQRDSQLSILAPGAFITSTYLGGGYATMAGTSMATPFVAGAAVVIHQALDEQHESSQADEAHILSIMQSTGVAIADVANGQDNVIHSGLTFERLDVESAVASILGASGAPGSSTPPPSPSESASADFINSLYKDLLGRTADAGGLNTWLNALNTGMPRIELVGILWDSAEHRAREVEQDYSQFLHRTPDAADLAHWTSALEAGVSERAVVAAFLHSTEYLQAHPDNGAFIQTLFSDLLGRPADPAGAAALENMLAAGVGRGALVDAVLNSVERAAHVIGDDYQQFLGRNASPAELLNWASLVARGMLDLPTVGEAILASDEFSHVAVQSASAGASSLSLSQPPITGGPSYSVAAGNAVATDNAVIEQAPQPASSPNVQTADMSFGGTGGRRLT